MSTSLYIGQLLTVVLAAVCPTWSVEVVHTDRSLWPSTISQEENCSLRMTSNHSGQCHCNQLYDIRCHGLNQVPQFVPDDRIYASIYMADQGITNLPHGAFSSLKVRKIVLNFNAIHDNLNVGAWSGVERVLQELQLAECRLQSLPNRLFKDMVELRYLHLWNNNISSISPNFFKGCENLRELLLWGNRIEHIDEDAFAGLWKLRRLDLDRNRIKTLSSDAFRHFRDLEVIHLGENRINQISSETFKYIRNLKVLSLDGNGLEHIYAKAFHGLGNLLSLALNNNKINFLSAEGLFINMTRLSTLLLRNNHLETVWHKTFSGLKALTRLDLADNRLSELPEGMLQKSVKLRHVSLDNNQFKTISRCSILPSKRSQTQLQQHTSMVGASNPHQLRTLSVLGNPNLNCDCRLTWLVDISERDGVSVVGTCSESRHITSPTSVNDRLAYSSLNCPRTADCKQ